MREGHFQVWSDMGYMIPPFAACESAFRSPGKILCSPPLDLGVTTNSTDLITIALEQFSLESSALLNSSTHLYRHVNDFDPRAWVTGNGWMAMGLMRVVSR
jgi:hypothetical protein